MMTHATPSRGAAPAARVVIVSPALAPANNGNWQTARRWARLLAPHHPVRISGSWPDPGARDARGHWRDDVMLALHARRMAEPVAQWARERGSAGLGVVLTGTDLYRDIQHDAAARHSLDVAQRLVVLQELGLRELEPHWRAKAEVVLQSTTNRRTLSKTRRHLTAIMVGHLRGEKSPETLWQAAAQIDPGEGIRLLHVGRALEPELAQQAQAVAARCPHYRWLGECSHERTRRLIQQAHVLVHPSRMEGGAHVVMEAVCSGTPVLASAIGGNLGLLGEDYAGCFPVGDAAALVHGLRRLRLAQRAGDAPEVAEARRWALHLAAQCEARRPLFQPEAEAAALRALVRRLSGAEP